MERLGPTDPAFAETTPYAPNSPYAASKASSDHLVRAYHHTFGLPTLTTNCSNNYGPYQYPGKADSADDPQRADGQAAAGLRRRPAGPRLAVRRGPLRGHSHGARRAGGRARPTTSAAGRNARTSRSSTCSATNWTGCSREPDGGSYRRQINYVKDRPGHDRRYAINADKIQAELGWTPLESFETGMRKTIEWYLANQDWVNGMMSEKYGEWIALNYANR